MHTILGVLGLAVALTTAPTMAAAAVAPGQPQPLINTVPCSPDRQDFVWVRAAAYTDCFANAGVKDVRSHQLIGPGTISSGNNVVVANFFNPKDMFMSFGHKIGKWQTMPFPGRGWRLTTVIIR